MGTGPGTAAQRKDPSIVQNKGPDVHQGRKNHPLPQPDLVFALKAGTRTVFYSSTAKPLSGTHGINSGLQLILPLPEGDSD